MSVGDYMLVKQTVEAEVFVGVQNNSILWKNIVNEIKTQANLNLMV